MGKSVSNKKCIAANREKDEGADGFGPMDEIGHYTIKTLMNQIKPL